MHVELKINKKSFLAFLYILSFAFVIYKNGSSSLPWFIPYIHCMFWILVGNIYKSNNKNKENQKLKIISKHCVRAFVGVQGIFWGFSAFGYIFNMEYMTTNIITRAISTTCQSLLIIFSAVSVFAIFRENIVKYSFAALIIKNIYFIIVGAINYGFVRFFSIVLFPIKYDEVWSVNKILESIELHDLTFALGFILIFFFEYLTEFCRNKKEKKNTILMLIVTSFFIYVGYKRIQLLALILILVISIIIKGRTKRSIMYWTTVVLIVTMVLLYGFIWIIDSGVLNNLLVLIGMNSRGRIEAYNAMATIFDFTPLYLGRGKDSGVRIKEMLFGNSIILGHSDVLYAFIDYGFWGFGIWITYSFFYITKKLNKVFENKVARFWLLCTVYAFITYLTDNTLNYFAFQTVFVSVILNYILIYENKKSLSIN